MSPRASSEAGSESALRWTVAVPPSTTTPRPARSDREPHLLQSDRRGDRKAAREDSQRQGVRGFGDDIPAFLRRPVVVRA